MLERFVNTILTIMYTTINIMFFVLLAPLIFAMFLVDYVLDGFKKKCKYHNVCPHYSGQSVTCTETGGQYSHGEFAQCYHKFEGRKRVRRRTWK